MERHRLHVAALSAFLLCVSSACSTNVDAGGLPGTSKVDPSTGQLSNGLPNKGGSMAAQGPQDQDTLRQQQRDALLRQYLADAEQQRLKGNLEAALRFLNQARLVAPGNREVQQQIESLRREMGFAAPTGRDYAQDIVRQQKLIEQRAITEVKNLLQSGKQAAEEGNFEQAIKFFRQANLQVEVGADFDWGPLADQAKTLLADTETKRDVADRERAEQLQAETQRRLNEEARRNDAQRVAATNKYLELAHLAFKRQQFSDAQDFANDALRVDPQNPYARDLAVAAAKLQRERRTNRYYYEKTQQYLRMRESRAELKVPQTSVLEIDNDIWARANRRPKPSAPTSSRTPADTELLTKVVNTMVGSQDFNEENGGYEDVFKLLSTVTNMPIIVTAAGKEVIGSESLKLKMKLVSPISLGNLLDEMMSRSEQLAWMVKNRVVQITTKAKAGGSNVTKVLDVRSLTFPLTKFIAPLIKGIPTEDADSSRPRTGGEEDEKVQQIEPEALVTNIKEATDPTYWEGEGPAIEYLEGGYLLVKASPTMQQKVAAFLENVTRYSTSVVTVESKFLTVQENYLQEIGVDFRGTGGTGNKGTIAPLDDVTNGNDDKAGRGLDNAGSGDPSASPLSGLFFNDGGDGDIRGRTENFFRNSLGKVMTPTGGLTAAVTFLDDLEIQMILRAVQKSENIQIVNSQQVTVLNNAIANVAVINQTSYIRDFDVEVAQAAFIADPKVDVIHDGVVLDVRPVISHDRRSVLLVMQPTVAQLVRPIETFTTSLSGSTLPVTLQLPQLIVRSFATAAQVPDGGSVLIGGLRQVTTRERRAEVPFLAKLPILSFFFKQEGQVDENSSLMVMVRAQITDVVDAMNGRR